MFIRLFTNTNKQEEAIRIFNSIFDNFNEYFRNKEISKSEPYWKMNGVYVVEANIEFLGDITDKIFTEFLESIADKWLYFGNPVDEALASDTTEECKFIKNGIKMINIFY